MGFWRSLVAAATLACLIALAYSAGTWSINKGFSSPSSEETDVAGTLSAPVRLDGTVMSVAEFQTWLARRKYYKGKIDGWVSSDYINSQTQKAWDAAYNDQCGVEDVRTALAARGSETKSPALWQEAPQSGETE